MKKKVISLIFGLFLSVGLAVVGYLNLIIAIGLSLAKVNDWWVYVVYLIWGLAVLNFITSILVFKVPKLSSIIHFVSCVFVIFIIVYLLMQNMISIPIICLFIIVIFVGLIAGILAVKSSRKIDTINNSI
jgi:hypothetical protein